MTDPGRHGDRLVAQPADPANAWARRDAADAPARSRGNITTRRDLAALPFKKE